MIRFFKNIPETSFNLFGRGLTQNRKYFSSSSSDGEKAQSNALPDVIQKRQFITNLYGIEVKKHIFPNFTKTINVSP
jgi:hypothetical protein